MDQIGSILREARMALGITYEQVEEDIMIKKRYLQAMEDGEWSKLPGRAYAKGFLRSYAQYLKVNVTSVMELFEVEVRPDAAVSNTVIIREVPIEPRHKIELNNKPKKNLIMVLSILSILLLLGVQWACRTYLGPSSAGQPSQAAGETAAASPDSGQEAAGGSDTVPPQEEPAAEAPKNTIDVMVLAQEEACWVRLEDSGTKIYEGTLKPGEKVEFFNIKKMYIAAGNAGAIQVTINGQTLDTLGEFGKVVKKTYTVENGVLIDLS